jgi:hypothetical protein
LQVFRGGTQLRALSRTLEIGTRSLRPSHGRSEEDNSN